MKNKILLVDDDLSIRSLLTILLEIEGFDVIKFHELSIESIISTIKQEKPDVVLLDVHLEGINGIDILKTIRSDLSLSSIRIIMSSGNDLKEICINAGANEFLMKPYMPADLLEFIKV